MDKRLSALSVPSIFKLTVTLLTFTFLSACISTSMIDVPSQEPVSIEDRAVVDGKPLPLPTDDQSYDESKLSSGTRMQTHTLSDEIPMSPVVRRLITSSEDQRRLRNWIGAANSLERALRIEPRNGPLWSLLAQVRYDQKEWSKAIQLAAKSNTLSGGNVNLLRQNWVLMANSYDALGNYDLAERFREKLR